MVNNTPLRLVAIDDSLEEESDESAAPVNPITDADAITRRVPDCEMIAAHETMRDKTPGVGVVQQGARPSQPMAARRPRRRLRLLLAGGALLVSALAVVGWRATAMSVATRPKVAPWGIGSSASAEAAKVAIPAAPVVAAPAEVKAGPEVKAAPEVIRLEVRAEPVEAELSLDGNVLAGHRLNLQVPKDRGIHVVSASAPGYVPFNQHVSFAGDVVLSINLRRNHTNPIRQAARVRPVHSEVRPRDDSMAKAEQQARRIEPGMNLEGPSMRRSAKEIDERNPYKP
jgi:hypothetical protein